jgi:DNA-binding transcriptional MerR regulator
VTTDVLSIGALARRSGVSAHTLRYYEASGILLPVTRSPSGHRRYRSSDVAWLAFVLRLKATGMPLAQIQAYAALRAAGEGTNADRMAMLQLHRHRLATTIAELSTAAKLLDEKILTYQEALARMAV